MAIKIDQDTCTGCGACMDVCPVDAIKIEEMKAVVLETCLGCGACISQCFAKAISF